MPVFMDTGGGDIYVGPDKDSVIAAMKADIGDDNFREIAEDIFEVPGTMKMRISEEITAPELSTLEEQYDAAFGAYCIASENC